MTLFDLILEVEHQAVRLERARAVLSEVEDYFSAGVKPGSYEAQYLLARSEHILLLLHVADDLFLPVLDNLQDIAKHLRDKNQASKETVEKQREVRVYVSNQF